MPSRRAFLATGVLLATPGCLSLDGPSARVALIRLENDDVVAREFALTVTMDGETVHDEVHTVASGEKTTPIRPFEDRPDARGEVTVESTLVGVGETEVSTFDEACYDITIEYDTEDLLHWLQSAEACATVIES